MKKQEFKSDWSAWNPFDLPFWGNLSLIGGGFMGFVCMFAVLSHAVETNTKAVQGRSIPNKPPRKIVHHLTQVRKEKLPNGQTITVRRKVDTLGHSWKCFVIPGWCRNAQREQQ